MYVSQQVVFDESKFHFTNSIDVSALKTQIEQMIISPTEIEENSTNKIEDLLEGMFPSLNLEIASHNQISNRNVNLQLTDANLEEKTICF